MQKFIDFASGPLGSTPCDSAPNAWFEITLTESEMEFTCSERSRISLDDSINNPFILAQITAAAERIHQKLTGNPNGSSITSENPSSKPRVISVELNGISDADLDLDIVRNVLGVPEAPKMQDFTIDEVTFLLSDVLGYEVSTLVGLDYGDRGDTLQIRYSEMYTENGSTRRTGIIRMSFHDYDLKPMTVNHLGNFLHSYKYHGEEVALATLIHINEKAA